MTERRLLAALATAALLISGAAQASDDAMLRAFNDAVRTLPAAPAATSRPASPDKLRATAAEKRRRSAPSKTENTAAVTLPKKEGEHDAKQATRQTEKQPLTQQVATLRQAQKNARAQQAAHIAQLTDQVNNAIAAAMRSEEALKREQAKHAKALADAQSENKKTQQARRTDYEQQLATQLRDAAAKRTALQRELDQQRSSLVAQQREAHDKEKQRLESRIAGLEAALKAAQKTPDALAEPQGDTARSSYSLGQFIASNVVVQLQMVKDSGVPFDLDALIAGLTTQLKTGQSALASAEMAQRYAAMQAALNKALVTLLEKNDAQLARLGAGRKVLKSDEGVRWFTVKPAKKPLSADQSVAVQVKVSTLGGKLINDFKDDKVPFNRSVPPLLYEAMALSGKGGTVEGWALAKDIAAREPLPAWVAPYDIIHYALTLR
ncbi:hypothetical protein LU196_19820 [Pantoea sp. Mb-10]|uniref:FKBP-type peptidyl-prolyl cis-trans isomerase N-terminal domain-containing protein n=1 Tax=unclassified Pantoea TaxID=2630326 RepID=UPI001E3F59BC|nr:MULTISPECIES: FKBP-type peptidyl-prolyl cis-trans isomerase N-terminal domain-containing protein [unclassified Pantoea]MCE0492286.1 hypothetical protein [Pantoea sp. Mb-10]MCE0503251.1 hypothetical protein [Pantoea sp. Pb-8]